MQLGSGDWRRPAGRLSTVVVVATLLTLLGARSPRALADDPHQSVGFPADESVVIHAPKSGKAKSKPTPAITQACEADAGRSVPVQLASTGDANAAPANVVGTWDPRGLSAVEARTYPTSAIVVIRSANLSGCSGALYAPNMVVTAGHCVFEHGEWAQGLQVYPGRFGNECPFGQASAVSLHTTKAWVESADDEYDYGVIRLDAPLGETAGWLGYGWKSDASLKDTTLSLTGYSFHFATLPIPTNPSPHVMRATPAKVIERLALYAHDAWPGDSGAPLFSSDKRIRAIHGYGCRGRDVLGNCPVGGADLDRLNYGVRVTRRVAQNLRAWALLP